jgi:hypothetical protein
MKRFLQFCVVLTLALVVGSCGGNSTLDNSQAAVFLTVEIEENVPDVDLCAQNFDLTVGRMTINSSAKNTEANLTSSQDVNLTRWVITPYRTDDANATPSPEWSYNQAVYVPADGQADLENYRVYPLELMREIPLAYLLPENGGFDPETGNTNIRQSLQLQLFGETISGKSVATEKVSIAYNFFCLAQDAQ